jgi:hypothetical protein
LKSPDSKKLMKTNESNFASFGFHFLPFVFPEIARWLHSDASAGAPGLRPGALSRARANRPGGGDPPFAV